MASTESTARHLLQTVQEVRAEMKEDNLPVAAAGIGFFSLVAMVPALIAVISIYALVADPDEIESQIADVTEALPEEATQLITSQLASITESAGGGLGVAAIIGIGAAVFTASAAVKHLLAALNVVFEKPETRSPLVLRAVAVAFTLGAALFVVVAAAALSALPALLGESSLGDGARWAIGTLRFPALGLVMAGALSTLYYLGPSQPPHGFRWLTAGSVTATILWIIVSAAFSIYTANFGSYNETYGSLGAIIILMMWLYLTALMVLLGAEIDAVRAGAAGRLGDQRAPVSGGAPAPEGGSDVARIVLLAALVGAAAATAGRRVRRGP